jgi:hypothetical protein
MQADPQVPQAATTKAKSWRPRVSLLTLLLLTAAIVLGISHLATSHREKALLQQVAGLNAERQKLRDELGYFDIADSKKIHVRNIREQTEHTWKWRVYLPPGTFHLNCAVEGIPQQGFEAPPHLTDVITSKGESHVYEVAIREAAEGKWQLVLRQAGQGALRSGMPPDHDLVRKADLRGSTSSCAGLSEAEIAPNDQPLSLLRMRVTARDRDPSDKAAPFPDPTTPCDGVLIWIEPAQ